MSELVRGPGDPGHKRAERGAPRSSLSRTLETDLLRTLQLRAAWWPRQLLVNPASSGEDMVDNGGKASWLPM